MFGLIFLLLIVVPIVELWVLFQVADSLGWAFSLLSLLAISLIGSALVRWQTAGAFSRVTDKLQRGEVPSNELIDGALMLFGGALLLTPGFFTDAVGLAMFIPPLRSLARGLVRRRMKGRIETFSTAVRTGAGARIGGLGDFGTANRDRRAGSFIDVEEVVVERTPSPDPLTD